MNNELRVFSGTGNPQLAKRVCAHLNIEPGLVSIESFPDGETFLSVHDDVRGRDCFVVQSTCPPVNDNLMELLIFIDCLRRASARRITAVIPYFGYARQDRKTEGRTPITAKLVANMITAAGADRVLTMNLHADQIPAFFDIPVDHLNVPGHGQGLFERGLRGVAGQIERETASDQEESGSQHPPAAALAEAAGWPLARMSIPLHMNSSSKTAHHGSREKPPLGSRDTIPYQVSGNALMDERADYANLARLQVPRRRGTQRAISLFARTPDQAQHRTRIRDPAA